MRVGSEEENARSCLMLLSFFFFQAEDGIRDLTVTGVQTCALPISVSWRPAGRRRTTPWPSQVHRGSARGERAGRRLQHADDANTVGGGGARRLRDRKSVV